MSRINNLGDSRSLLYYPREQPTPRTSSPKKSNAAYSSAAAVISPNKSSSATWTLPTSSRKRHHSPDPVHVHSSQSKHACPCPCCATDDVEDGERRPAKSKSDLSSKSTLILAGSSGPNRANTKHKIQPVPLGNLSKKVLAAKSSTSTTSTSSGYSSGSASLTNVKATASKSTLVHLPQPVAVGSTTQLPSKNVKAVVPKSDFPLPPRSTASYRRINRVQLRGKLIKELHVEPNLVDVILSSILETPPGVGFEDVVGQEQAVRMLRERVVYPALNPTVSQ